MMFRSLGRWGLGVEEFGTLRGRGTLRGDALYVGTH